MELILNKQMEKKIVYKDNIYTPSLIAQLELIPTRKKNGGPTKIDTILRYIIDGKLKDIPHMRSISKDGRVFRFIKGSEIIRFNKTYRPQYKTPVR